MVEPRTGLPADNIDGSLHPRSRSTYTSPTNIGMYLWATLSARDLGFISSAEATERIAKTLRTVERLERHEPSGQFWNWYSPQTGEKVTVWPDDGNHVFQFASSVDNGWLASALIMVANAVPELSARAWALAESMDFGCYYDPAKGPDAGAGLIRGGFWLTDDAPPGNWPVDDYCGMGEQVAYTGHHYGAFNTEPRIASYIGIALDQIPRSTTSAAGAPSPTPATGAGRSSAPSASGERISAWTFSRAPTRTATSSSSRPGAAACSRRSWSRSWFPRRTGDR
jgi:hypothetical protein